MLRVKKLLVTKVFFRLEVVVDVNMPQAGLHDTD